MDGTPQITLTPNVSAAMTVRTVADILYAGFALLVVRIMYFLGEPPAYLQTRTAWFVWILVIGGGVIVHLAVSFFNFRSMEYRFFDDGVETYEGFLNVRHNETTYNMITDVHLSRPVWQRVFGTGTVHLNTAGSSRHELSIGWVDNSQDAYEQVRQLIRESRDMEQQAGTRRPA